ncbi:NHLP bacteriocin export ABC transporter permease/ATPase subunit [Pontibacter sp. G13]|uniref:NHLP bacteriocin export ABC transporter permease/ATPase subunit n=1 Tax=Pontibacter sp. G13 TaxID=3074898 RepID=UPI00288BD2A9|nr:NHLP bacteriocin export ABC transporter permease/ATPase subunit [Pontibacter sp. G13]WNJ16376.1 NHLP bacteriocin export ABC transporter permease/ATPase subunit [Pontibacter sp. G13]
MMNEIPTPIQLVGNKPFLLLRHDCLWIVVDGQVEVYYTVLDEKGEINSARRYMYTAGKGEMLLSLKSEPDQPGICMMAVSGRAKMVEVNKNWLARLNDQQLQFKVEQLIFRFSSFIQANQPPRTYQPLAVGIKAGLEEGTYGYPTKGLVWAALKSGDANVMGNVQISPETKKKLLREFFPVTSTFWFQSTSDDTQIEVISTSQLIEDEVNLMISLKYFEEFVQEVIRRKIVSESNEEYDRLAFRMNHQASLVSKSLSNLKQILTGTHQSSLTNAHTKLAISAVCQRIGKEVGVEMKIPKEGLSEMTSQVQQLKAIAQGSNVRVRKVILRGEWWKEENGHLVAFTKETATPVALIQHAKKGEYEQYDPEGNSRLVTQAEAAELEPVAYMFFYAFDQKISSVRKIGEFAVRGLKVDIGFILAAALAGSLIGLIIPTLTGMIYGDVIPQADRSFLWEVFGILLMVGVVSALLQLIQGILLLRVETKSNINIQAGLMDHLLRLPVSFYKKFAAGDLAMRSLGINQIRRIFSDTVLTAVLSGTFSIVNLFLLFYYDSHLAWVGLGLALLAIIFTTVVGLFKLRYDRQIANHQGDIQGYLFELLSGIAKLRVTGTEKRLFAVWANKFATLKNLGFRSVNYQNYTTVFNATYPLLTNILFFGALFYLIENALPGTRGMISVGVFMAFVSAFNQFLNDCLSMSHALITSLNVVPLYERLKPILDEEPESEHGSVDPGTLQGEIELAGISFRYNENQPLVLKGVSFRIKPGEMVAFVGPSGSGKSTIMRLLLGFEEAESGSIFYDGQDFETLNKELVRQQMGVVLQHSALMAGSIYKNIVGNSELTLEQALEAVEMAGLREDIEQMPMGMHTIISEGASTFSGGQRQRLMIARAIVHKPGILFMDEATSALDNRTQAIVSRSLESLKATRIVIAHRLSTIVNADRIFVMKDGEIVETGSYQELLDQNGLFAELAQRQLA